METGTVKWYNVSKGIGFITPDDGSEEVFLSRGENSKVILEGERVLYVKVILPKGNKATQVFRL